MRAPLAMLLLLAACGGAPPQAEPVKQQVSVLVRDEYLVGEGCAELASFGVKAVLEVTGVLGACNVRVKEDGTALSICDRIPGKSQRELTLTVFIEQKSAILELTSATKMLDLTSETRAMVDLDFTWAERILNDDDADGTSNVRELCEGRDPRDPTG